MLSDGLRCICGSYWQSSTNAQVPTKVQVASAGDIPGHVKL
jgi:hypothetical protein